VSGFVNGHGALLTTTLTPNGGQGLVPQDCPLGTPRAWPTARTRRAGARDHVAYCAAVAALQEVSPELTIKEASAETTNAISFASTYHSGWFWAGVGR
jgi:hypothetical protein